MAIKPASNTLWVYQFAITGS